MEDQNRASIWIAVALMYQEMLGGTFFAKKAAKSANQSYTVPAGPAAVFLLQGILISLWSLHVLSVNSNLESFWSSWAERIVVRMS